MIERIFSAWSAVQAHGLSLTLAGLAVVATALTGFAQAQEAVAPREGTAPRATSRPSNSRPAPARPAEVRDDPTSAISRLAIAPARSVVFTEEREAAARAFVRKNRPEMEAVLDQLKSARLPEYQRVICDLFRTSESFTALWQEDRQRSEIALSIWKVEAKTHLLAAELASHPAQNERLKLELRDTVEQLADLQIEQSALEVKRLEAKLRRAEGQRSKIESRRAEFINERTEAILQAVARLQETNDRQAAP